MPHILGDHATIIIQTAKHCQPATSSPDQADALIAAVLHCIDLAGGITQASSPRFDTSPDKPVLGSRTRSTPTQAIPMNPVSRHHGTGSSTRPPSDTDSGYWRHEYQIAPSHFDRCDVIRRAARYLASLIQRDPKAPTGSLTARDVKVDILINGAGWPPADVARRYHVTERTVTLARIDDDRHPLTGQHWTPPEHNTFAAAAAREMRAAGVACVDIALSLQRNVNTVYAWTTGTRRAAA
jgi:hypothetical protein